MSFNAVEQTNQKLRTNPELSEENRQFLLDFKDYMFSQDISQGRIARYLYSWYRMRDHIDFDLENPEKDDIITLVGKINQDEIKEMDCASCAKKNEAARSSGSATSTHTSPPSHFKPASTKTMTVPQSLSTHSSQHCGKAGTNTEQTNRTLKDQADQHRTGGTKKHTSSHPTPKPTGSTDLGE